MPFLMVLLTLAFLGTVIYQATRDETSGPGDALSSGAPHAAGGSVDSDPRAGLAGEPAQPSDPSPLPTSTERQALPSDLDVVRATIQGFFDRMPADISKLENPLSIVQARDELRNYLDSLSPEAASLLIEMLGTEPDFVNRRFLLYALAKMGTDVAVDGLAAHYWRMEELENESEIFHSVTALGQVGTPHSYDVILDFVERSAPHQHRARFVRALGDHPDVRRAVPTLIRLLREDTTTKVRVNAAQALTKSKDLNAAGDIERALETERHPFVRQAMIGALGGIRDVNSLPSLERILQTDQDHVDRMSAVSAVSKIGGDSARRILEKTAKEDTHDRVRFDAERALRRMNEEG